MHPAGLPRRAPAAPYPHASQDPAPATGNPAATPAAAPAAAPAAIDRFDHFDHFDRLSNEMVDLVFSYTPLDDPHTVRTLSLTSSRWFLCASPARHLLHARLRASGLGGLAHADPRQTLAPILGDISEQGQGVRKQTLLFLIPRCLRLWHHQLHHECAEELLQAIAGLENSQDRKELFGVFEQLVQPLAIDCPPHAPYLPQLVEYMQALEMTVDETMLATSQGIEKWIYGGGASGQPHVSDQAGAGLTPGSAPASSMGIVRNPKAINRPRSASLRRAPEANPAVLEGDACLFQVDEHLARLRDRRGYSASCAAIRGDLLLDLRTMGCVDRCAAIRHAIEAAPTFSARAGLKLLGTLARAARSLPDGMQVGLANAFVQALDASRGRHRILPAGAAANLALACARAPGLKDGHLVIARILELVEPLDDRAQRPVLVKFLQAIGMVDVPHAAPLFALLLDKEGINGAGRLWNMLSPELMQHITSSLLTPVFASILERMPKRRSHHFLNRLLAGFFAACRGCKGEIEPGIVRALLESCLKCRHTTDRISLGQGETPMFWYQVTRLCLLVLKPGQCPLLLNDLLAAAKKLPGHGSLIRTEVIRILGEGGAHWAGADMDMHALCRRMVEDEYTALNLHYHRFVPEGDPETFLRRVFALLPGLPRAQAHDLALLLAQRFTSLPSIGAAPMISPWLPALIGHVSWPLLKSGEERLATLHQLLGLLDAARLGSDDKALVLISLAMKLGDCPCDNHYPQACALLIRHVRNNIERWDEDRYDVGVFEDLRNILCKPTLGMDDAAGAVMWRKVDEQLRQLGQAWHRV